ncbi:MULTISPECIES: biosynthetic peptidoglycan transglycosylase [Shewanella]|uniref:biosynthetic peptidoglycan transglycosylase n=1 Tax=Shewanella TaxID=22 RepID=UPI00201A43D7|nr:biosynthetic peptidoglycan transglycosylase [Shewanella sp. 10B]
MRNDWKLICKEIERIRSQKGHVEISENLFAHLVAGEDHRFWFHLGFDPIGLLRAFWCSKFKKTRQGGSTIAMQLVRTLTSNYEFTLSRKVKEILIAIMLTYSYERDEILKIYLLVAYFGWNMHGIEQTCKKLNLKIDKLNDHQSASVIARLKYPEPRFFDNNKSKLISLRANHILNRYHKLNFKGQHGTI